MVLFMQRRAGAANDHPTKFAIDGSVDGENWQPISTGRNSLLFVLNMTPMMWEDYKVSVPKKKKYKLVLNSDALEYGGNGNALPAELGAEADEDGKYSVTFDLPPYCAAVFLF